MPTDGVPAAEPDDFDDMYVAVGDDLERIPWARLEPQPGLVSWLDDHPEIGPGRALVVACGLGDDAAELARRGHVVSAFDRSPTAIGWCRRRFVDEPVEFVVADLFDLAADWSRHFDLVVEVNTVQSLPLAQRRAGIAAIADTVGPGGYLFVRCLARGDDEPVGSRPWPLSKADLAGFVSAGLQQMSLSAKPQGDKRWFQAVYARA